MALPSRTPVVTKRTRTPNPGFINPNKGIEVAAGLNMQDVPRELIIQHMREAEHFWKAKFQAQHGAHGAQQSF